MTQRTTGRLLVFDPTELPQKTVVRQTSGGTRKQTYYYAPCLTGVSRACKGHRWLQLSDLDSASCVNCQRAGVLAANYETTLELLRQRQIAKPSGPEARFMGTCHSYSLPYEQQVKVRYQNERGQERCYLIDFVIAGLIAVEVNGAYYPDPIAKARRDEHLKTICPYPLAFFYEDEMLSRPGNYYRRFDTLINDHLAWRGQNYEYITL